MLIKTQTTTIKQLLIIFSLLITGCRKTQAPVVSPTSTSLLIVPTKQTPVPATQSKTLQPSLTPLPTIPHNKIHQSFETLLATNGNCRLPCFWGITPGKSTIAELIQFTEQFTKPYATDLVFDNGTYTFRYLDSSEISYWVVQFSSERDKVTKIDIIAETAQFSFPLGKIFNEYGKPEKILIGPKTIDALPMIVLYENQGFIGYYYLYQDDSDKTVYCYSSHGTSQEIITWSPGENWFGYIDQIEMSSYKPLDELSDYDIQSFYEYLKQDFESLCMKIQTDEIL